MAASSRSRRAVVDLARLAAIPITLMAAALSEPRARPQAPAPHRGAAASPQASAALPLARGRGRSCAVARDGITRVDRLGRRPLAGRLARASQARQALAVATPISFYGSLSAIEANSLACGDRRLASIAGRAPRGGQGLARALLEELLGANVDINDAVLDARFRSEPHRCRRTPAKRAPPPRRLARRRRPSLAPPIATDGFFEVGSALAPVRVLEGRIPRVVKHPRKGPRCCSRRRT